MSADTLGHASTTRAAHLAGRTVLIVGGTSGFGLGVAGRCADASARLVLVGRDAAKVERIRTELGARADVSAHALDAADPAAAQALFDHVGPIDHLVSTLGGAMGGGFLSADAAIIRATVESKLFANLALARAAAAQVRNGGSMTFTAGAGGSAGTASGAVLGNQAIATMVRGLAAELAPRVRVNAVAPAWTVTPLWRDVPADEVERTRRSMAQLIPLGRTATVPEVSDAYLFLMTATFVTGHTLFVDGGVSLVGS